MRFKAYQGPRTKAGLPDRRSVAGRVAWTRSEAAKRGWETRRERQKEEERHYRREEIRDREFEQETFVEEPIETVGGKRYGKKGR